MKNKLSWILEGVNIQRDLFLGQWSHVFFRIKIYFPKTYQEKDFLNF